MSAPDPWSNRSARALLLVFLLLPSVAGCGRWERARLVTLRAPVAFAQRVLVIGDREAWELELARVEDTRVVGRCLRRWSVPPGAEHRWGRYELSPDATAAANPWTLASSEPAEIAIAREAVRHLLFLDEGAAPAGAFVIAGLLSLVAFVTGAWAISGGRID